MSVVVVVVLVLIALPVVLMAAQGGRLPPWRQPLVMMRGPGLQEELQLSEEQKEQMNPMLRGIGDYFQEEGQALQDLAGPKRAEKLEELKRKVAEEAHKGLIPILRPEQMERLQQIQLQFKGPQAFLDAKVQTALGLSEEQSSRMREVIEAMREKIQAMFAGRGGGNPQDRAQKIGAMRKTYMEEMLALLSDKQKETWQQMTGKPFHPKAAEDQ